MLLNRSSLLLAASAVSCLFLGACDSSASGAGAGAHVTGQVAATSPGGNQRNGTVGAEGHSANADRSETGLTGAGVGVSDTSLGGTPPGSNRTGATNDSRRRPPGLEGVDLSSLSDTARTPLVVPDVPSSAPTVSSTLVVMNGEDTARFGKVIEGDDGEHIFELSIQGSEPITIFEEKSTCGCTAGSIEVIRADGTSASYTIGSVVPVDAKLRVHGTLKTEGKRGENHHTITLRHNGSNRATLLHFECDVVPIFELEPSPYLNFQELFVNETKTATVTVTSSVLEAFRLDLDTSFGLPPYLRVVLEAVDPQADGRAGKWLVHGTIGPDTPASLGGQQGLTVLLKTDIPLPNAAPMPDGSARTRTLSLFAAARVKALVNAQPSYVSFGAVTPGSEAERLFTIEIADADFVTDVAKLASAHIVARDPKDQELYDTLFKTRVEQVLGTSRYEVYVSFASWPSDHIGPFGGTIEVPVGHPTKPMLEVPFSGVSRIPPTAAGR